MNGSRITKGLLMNWNNLVILGVCATLISCRASFADSDPALEVKATSGSGEQGGKPADVSVQKGESETSPPAAGQGSTAVDPEKELVPTQDPPTIVTVRVGTTVEVKAHPCVAPAKTVAVEQGMDRNFDGILQPEEIQEKLLDCRIKNQDNPSQN